MPRESSEQPMPMPLPNVEVVGAELPDGRAVAVYPQHAVEVLPDIDQEAFTPIDGVTIIEVPHGQSVGSFANDVSHEIMLHQARTNGGVSRQIGTRVVGPLADVRVLVNVVKRT